MQITAYIVPILFIIVLCVSIVKKQNAYAGFVDGVGQSISLIVKVFPYLLTIMMAVEVFRASGVSAIVANFVSPFFNFFGIPPQLSELMLLRPLSGAGSLSVLDNIYATYGVDSYIANCASAVYGSSETVFYVATIYFSGGNIRKLRYAIPVALVATFVGSIIACAVCRYI